MSQFATQTIGYSVGTMAFACVSAFLGLSGTMLYKATLNLHTKELFKRPVLLLVGWLVCGSNLISKAYGHEITGNNFATGLLILSGLSVYPKV